MLAVIFRILPTGIMLKAEVYEIQETSKILDIDIEIWRQILQPVSVDKIEWDYLRIDTINSIVFTPKNSKIIYAATGIGLHRSVDSGKNWKLINNDIKVSGTLIIDPNNTSVMYANNAYIKSENTVGIIKSIDSGFNWQLLAEPEMRGCLEHNNILVDHNNSSMVYVAGMGCIYKSTNAGLSWEKVGNDIGSYSGDDFSIFDPIVLVAGRQKPSILYAGIMNRTSSRILKSVDDGKNWIDIDNGIDYPYYLETIAISPLDSNTIYAVFSSKLYRSTDGGQNWKELKNSPSKKYNTFHNDIALTNDPNIIYVKAEGDIYSSADGGTNWKQPYQDNEEMDIDFFAVDPQNHKIIYAINHGKLYKSTNSGRKWKIILLPRA